MFWLGRNVVVEGDAGLPGPAVLDGVEVTDQTGTTPGFVSMTRPRGGVATAATGRFADVTQATSSAGWR